MGEFRWWVSLLLAVSSILAFAANSLLLLVFFKRRGLRTVSNRFVINLLVTNLLSGIILIPLLMINETVLDGNEEKRVEKLSTNISEVMFEKEVNEVQTKIKANFYQTKLVENEEIIEINVVNDLDLIVEESNDFFCSFSQIVTNLICVASILGILLIAFDQYFAVIHPLRYHTFINKSKSLILLIAIWSFSLLISFVNLIVFEDSFWKITKNTNSLGSNDTNLKDLNVLEITFAYFYFLLIFLIPFLIICSVYFKIYFAAHQNSERMRKSLSNNQLIIKNQVNHISQVNEIKTDNLKANFDEKSLPRVHSAPNITNLNLSIKETKITRSISDRATSNNIIVTLKTKFSNASVFKYREESRTAKISILVIFMVLICYFPYGITIILNVYLRNNFPINFNFVSIVLLIISNIISPFLFAYRSKRVQRELIKTFFPTFLTLKRNRNRSAVQNGIKNEFEPFIKDNDKNRVKIEGGNDVKSVILPKVIVTCSKIVKSDFKNEKNEKNDKNEKCNKIDFDRWGSGKNWGGFKKKCNFISVPDSCLEARCSFSSASTQISSAEE